MLGSILENVRRTRPLVHCINNYVTANDCAMIVLACGASPIMADEPEEAEEIAARCRGLCLNTGTPDARRAASMLAAGKRANALGLPVVLDPVGAGTSRFRTELVRTLLGEVRFAVIRGNVSEIRVLAAGTDAAGGVDADAAVTEGNLASLTAFAMEFARRTGAVAAMTGAIDVVTDGKTAYLVRNGHPEMRYVTGAGCQLSALTAAFAAANPERPLEAAAAAVCTMGLAGELAYRRMKPEDGSASYRNYIIDAVRNMTPERLEEGADYEMR